MVQLQAWATHRQAPIEQLLTGLSPPLALASSEKGGKQSEAVEAGLPEELDSAPGNPRPPCSHSTR
jgi:hypothetical protein